MSLYFHSLFQTRNRHFLTPFPFARRNAEGLYFGGDRTTPSLNHTWAPRCSPKLASLAGCSTKYLRFRTLTRVSKVLGNSRCFSVRSSSETWCVLQRFDSLPNIHWRGNSGRWFTRSMCFSKKWDDHPPFSHHLTVSFRWFWAWESPRKTEKSDDCAWNLELQ